MKRISKPKTAGSALILALILLGVGTLALGWFLSQSNIAARLEGIFNKQVQLQNVAEAGFDIARVDLLERANKKDFTSFSDCVSVGLVSITEGSRPTVKPRFSRKHGSSIELRVFYFPDQNNGPSEDNQEPCNLMPGSVRSANDVTLPKYFHVVSEALNEKTGETFTKEGLILLRFEKWSEFSYAMLSPKLKPGMTKLRYKPATLSGHVHFGKPENPSIEMWFDGGDNPKHNFLGPVTFEANPPEGELPFQFYENHTDILFHKGFKTNHSLRANSTAIFQTIEQKAHTVLPGSSADHICLKFMPAGGGENGQDGIVSQYACNETEADVFKRYEGETALTGIQSPLQTWPADGIFLSDANVHVKGIINGSVTIASRSNIYIEGDLQYLDQTKQSNDLAGFLAKKNLIIPHGVPNGVSWQAWSVTQGSPLDMAETGVTNFIPDPDYDRDEAADSEYPTHWANPSSNSGDLPGYMNSAAELDLDGMYMAVEGGLVVDGINNWEESPVTGAVIPTAGGVNYSLDPDSPNYYYHKVPDGVGGERWTRKAPPLYCGTYHAQDLLGNCMLYNERPRAPRHGTIWIYGGLVVNDYTFTKIMRHRAVYNGPFDEVAGGVYVVGSNSPYQYIPWDQGTISSMSDTEVGFERRVIHHDERFFREQPPGFPSTDTPLIQVEWTKRFRGQSFKLTNTPPTS